MIEWNIDKYITRLINQTYKLLPLREEEANWRGQLDTVIEELNGMRIYVQYCDDSFFLLLCKLSGLKSLTEEGDFSLYRKTIFECLGLMKELKERHVWIQ